MLATLDLDEAGQARAAIARAVAGKLDVAVRSDLRPDPTAGLSKELREVVNELLEASGDDQEFTASLFEESV